MVGERWIRVTGKPSGRYEEDLQAHFAACMPMRPDPCAPPAPRSCPKPTRLIHYLRAPHQLVMDRRQQWVGQEMGEGE